MIYYSYHEDNRNRWIMPTSTTYANACASGHTTTDSDQKEDLRPASECGSDDSKTDCDLCETVAHTPSGITLAAEWPALCSNCFPVDNHTYKFFSKLEYQNPNSSVCLNQTSPCGWEATFPGLLKSTNYKAVENGEECDESADKLTRTTEVKFRLNIERGDSSEKVNVTLKVFVQGTVITGTLFQNTITLDSVKIDCNDLKGTEFINEVDSNHPSMSCGKTFETFLGEGGKFTISNFCCDQNDQDEMATAIVVQVADFPADQVSSIGEGISTGCSVSGDTLWNGEMGKVVGLAKYTDTGSSESIAGVTYTSAVLEYTSPNWVLKISCNSATMEFTKNSYPSHSPRGHYRFQCSTGTALIGQSVSTIRVI